MKVADSSSAHYALAVQCLKERNLESCFEHLIVAKVLARSGSDLRKALFALGCLSEERHHFEEAGKYYKLVGIDSALADCAHFRLGVLKMQEGCYIEAMQYLEEVLHADEFPARESLLHCLAACYSRLNVVHKAEEMALLLRNSGFRPLSISQVLLAESLIKSERWAEAQVALLCVTGSDSDAQFWSALGVCQYMLRDSQAFWCFRKCVSLEPSVPAHRMNMILAAELVHDGDQLEKKIVGEYMMLLPASKVLKFSEDPIPALQPVAAKVKRRRGLPGTPWFVGRSVVSEPIPVTDETRKIDAVSLCNLGCSAMVMEAFGHARILLQASLKLDGKCFEAMFNLGTLNLVEERVPEALEYLESAAKAFPRRQAVLLNYGVALNLSDRFQQAHSVLELAVRIDRDRKELLWLSKLALGKAKAGLSDLEGAMALFVECFTETDSTEALASIATLLLQLGQEQQAQKKAQVCVEREPLNPEYLYLLGQAKWKNSDLAGALDVFKQCVALKGTKRND